MGVLLELFIVFLKLGAFTIGGGIAMIPLLQNAMINEKKWFTKDEFVDIIAICQSLPGVVAINMATYVGYARKGFLGSMVSTCGVVLPSYVMIIIIAEFMARIGANQILSGAMAGFRAAALGLVVVAIIQLAQSVFKGIIPVIGAVLAFVLIAIFNVNTAYVILLFIAMGIASACIGGLRAKKLDSGSADEAGEGSNEGGEGEC